MLYIESNKKDDNMSRGKYSVSGYKKWPEGYEFKYNCYGQKCSPWTVEMIKDPDQIYDSKTMYGDYDEEGYDRYGYSSFDQDNIYVGDGEGIDRAGYTEYDYLTNKDGGDY